MSSEQVLLQLDSVHISSHLDNHSFRPRGTKPKTPSHRIVIYLQMAGFYNVTFLHGYKLVPALITALIERWRPETHTFHFSTGECTITLQDVAMQLGLPINGNAVVGHGSAGVIQLCDQFLGKIPTTSNCRGSRVKLSWLENKFNITEYSTEEEVQFAARAYILHTIGGILMPDKSGNYVSTQYLPFLTDFQETRQYSWGSAVLAFLYNEMCKATIVKDNIKSSDVGGCLTLLQSWTWYRLPYLTPITKAPIEFPLAGRLRHDLKKAGVVHNNVVDVRMMIESEGKDQFIWTPYEGQEVMYCVPQDVWECSPFWGSMVPLIHFSIVEFQCADRVLRQFSIFQPIPKPPTDIEHIHCRASTDDDLVYAISLWDTRFDWLPEEDTPIEDDDFNCSPEYEEWFNNNGKPILEAHENSQKWRAEQRCSYQYGGQTSEPYQSSEQPPSYTTINCPTDWPTWESHRHPRRVEVGSSHSSEPWENALHRHNTEVGGSTSSYPGHGDDFYRPQFEHLQSSTAGQGITVDSMTSWLATTTISSPLCPQDIYSTPPSMQRMDDELNQDEPTLDDPYARRRIVKPPRLYDQASSLHRQVLPKKKRR